MRSFKFPYYHLFPKFLSPSTYSKLKFTSRLWGVKERINSNKDSVKISPWAFIRVKNEIKTLEASLNSILPIIDKGIIGFNRCTDGSKEFILNFCKKNPSFIPLEYPHHIYPAGSSEYKNLDAIPYKNTLAAYYNAVLESIPQNEWLIKIDCDQIYIPEILNYSFSLPKNNHRVVSYSRLNFIKHNNQFKVFSYLRPNDHWLIFNKNLHFENSYAFKNGKHISYEILHLKNKNILYSECPCFHFPFEKNYRSHTSIKQTLYDIEKFCEQYPNEFDPKYFNQAYLDQITKQFK